jgi:hypothetical protein
MSNCQSGGPLTHRYQIAHNTTQFHADLNSAYRGNNWITQLSGDKFYFQINEDIMHMQTTLGWRLYNYLSNPVYINSLIKRTRLVIIVPACPNNLHNMPIDCVICLCSDFMCKSLWNSIDVRVPATSHLVPFIYLYLLSSFYPFTAITSGCTLLFKQ